MAMDPAVDKPSAVPVICVVRNTHHGRTVDFRSFIVFFWAETLAH